MTTISTLNTNGAATLAAAEGLAALGVGDTALARQKYAEAGAILERDMKAHDGGPEKQLLRFLAATQYYKGGDYQKAQELANKIDARALPKNVRGLLPQFLKDVKERVSPGYAAGIRQTLFSLWVATKPREAIAILQEHPYVLDTAALALFRATLCDQLPDYRAAAIFFAAALQRTSGAAQVAFISSATPLRLLSQGRMAEAWECVRHRLELVPHTATSVTAALVCYHRFLAAGIEDRQQRLDELLSFVAKAWEEYQRLPALQQNHPDMRAYMAFGFEIAAGSSLLHGDKEHSQAAWNQAVKLGADPANPWALRAFAASQGKAEGRATKDDLLSERETHFSTRFAPEAAIRQQLEMVGA